jgi:hypothetical protein
MLVAMVSSYRLGNPPKKTEPTRRLFSYQPGDALCSDDLLSSP